MEQFGITGPLLSTDFDNFSSGALISPDSTQYNNFYDLFDNYVDSPTFNIIGDFSCEDSDYYCWGDSQFFCTLDNMSFVAVPTMEVSAMIYIHIPSDYISRTIDYYYLYNRLLGSTNFSIESDYLSIIDGEYYYRYRIGTLYNTNLPIYEFRYLNNAPTTLSGLTDINPYVNTGTGGGGSSSESSANNLYLEDAYFLWTTYDPVNDNIIGDNFNVDNIYNSFVTFNYQLTPYQKEHLNQFTINVKASISYSLKFTGHSEYKNWSGSYLYQAPLSQFNTGSLKYNFLDIFNTTGFTSYFNDNYQGEIDFSNSSFKLTMDAELVDNKGGTSSDYIDIYDFLNDKVRNQSKAITNNNNPYVPTDTDNPIQNNAQVPTVQTGDGVVPTGNNSVSPSGSGTVNVVQNNNTGLINPKPVTDMVKNELLPNENDTNFVGLLAEQTHEDGFVSLMSATFSFVPVTFWNSLSHYFNIFLTMLVAFFALRLILDIL